MAASVQMDALKTDN